MNKLLYILVFLGIMFGLYLFLGQEGNKEIVITSPESGQEVSSTIELIGKARGSWYFEASAPVKLTDEKGNVLSQSFVTAEGEWMTEDLVGFKGLLSYESTYKGRGFVVFMNDNPSGDPSRDKSLSVPVILR